MTLVTVATRKSPLALAQCRAFLRDLSRAHADLETAELHVVTTGDRVQDRALSQIGGKGLFIKEIEEALLAGRADLAVHSLKDIPAEVAEGLLIGCVPRREDARDVIVTRDGRPFAELSPGSKVGTSSLRRRVLLAAARPDLEFVALRGNVDTRLRRCEEGVVDAVVLARAGLLRLGLADRATEVLEVDVCLPAIGQGALGVEQRVADARVAALLAPLADAEASLAVAAERGVMLAAQGSCQAPIAAYAVRRGAELWLRAALAREDGSRLVQLQAAAPWPSQHRDAHALGVALGADLRARVDEP